MFGAMIDVLIFLIKLVVTSKWVNIYWERQRERERETVGKTRDFIIEESCPWIKLICLIGIYKLNFNCIMLFNKYRLEIGLLSNSKN